jgi:hypothetical protein
MQYLQTVPARITHPLSPSAPPFLSTQCRVFAFPLLLSRAGAFNLHPGPTANGEIMIKPTSFQWNDGNYRVGCSWIPVFVHYSAAA